MLAVAAPSTYDDAAATAQPPKKDLGKNGTHSEDTLYCMKKVLILRRILFSEAKTCLLQISRGKIGKFKEKIT